MIERRTQTHPCVGAWRLVSLEIADAARWISGHTLFVDGGIMAGNLSLQGNTDFFAEMPLQREAHE